MPPNRVPFDSKGNLMHYAHDEYYYEDEVWTGHDPDWRDNEPFIAQMTLVDMHRGRSAAYFTWEDEQGHIYPMFMSDLVDLLKKNAVAEGKTLTSTQWIVKKKGMNYGIGLADV